MQIGLNTSQPENFKQIILHFFQYLILYASPHIYIQTSLHICTMHSEYKYWTYSSVFI